MGIYNPKYHRGHCAAVLYSLLLLLKCVTVRGCWMQSFLGRISTLSFSFKAVTALAHKSVKLPVHGMYLGGVYRALCKAGECVCVRVLTGKGSNSLTTVLISRLLRGLGISPRKMGGKRK